MTVSAYKYLLTVHMPHDVKSFLVLILYIAQYLPDLAEHTRILTPLTTKSADLRFLHWTSEHQRAFQGVEDMGQLEVSDGHQP